MSQDPMTSFEQAEAEADERFFEDRDDQEVVVDDDDPSRDPSLDYDEARDFEREKGDDDGVEYGDPRDEQEERRYGRD